MMNSFAFLEKRGKTFLWVFGLIVLTGVGILDYLTGIDFSLSLFYLIPISLIAWTLNSRSGGLMSILCTIVALIAEIATRPADFPITLFAWHTVIRFSFFIIVALLLSSFKKQLEIQKTLAQTDYLTGAASQSLFYGLVQMEIERLSRYKRPFSVAYMDLDNFKIINDNFGHNAGDAVLRAIVNQCKNQLRKTDVIARLGGDEIAILFPETNHDEVKCVIQDMSLNLSELMTMNEWSLTFSIGVATFTGAPNSQQEVINIVDTLMYTIKKRGKNGINYAIYP